MRARRLIATTVAVAASLAGVAAAQTSEPPDIPTAAEQLERQLAGERARHREELRRERERLRAARRTITGLRRAVARGGVDAPAPALRQIAACESGGDPAAVSDHGGSPWGPGLYRGKYQFDARTWRSVGGRGDPARAAEPEQDYRAWLLLRRSGTAPWPVCGAGAPA